MAPLAFGKSVFTKAAAGGAAGGAEFGFVTGTDGFDRAYSGTGTPNADGFMTVRPNAGSTKFSDSADFSIVLWFRALDGDFESGKEFGMLMQGASGTGPSYFSRDVELYMNGQRDGGGDANEHSINLFCKYSGGSRTLSTFGSSDYFGSGNTNWDAKVVDGNWHCVMARFATADSNRQLYLDGVDVKRSPSTGSGGDVTGTLNLDPASYAGTATDVNDADVNEAGFNFRFSHFIGAFGGAGGAFDIGPVWIYDSGIDFSSSSVRAQYYNDANTDGYVTAGSDGQTGGAAEAELFMTTDGSSMSNGGRLGTVTFHEVGNGTVTLTGSSTGPGSGDTRTSANT